MFITGYGIGFSAPCLSQVLTTKIKTKPNYLFPKLESEGILSEVELGWFASCLVLGQVLGSVLSPVLADKVTH